MVPLRNSKNPDKQMKFFILLLFLGTLTSCYQVERNCTQFKNGRYEFKYVIDDVEISGEFMRKDDLQVEYYNGKTDSSSVKWVNDCEFIANTINPKSMAEKKPVHIKILTTSEESYTFEYSLVGNEKNKQRGVAKKID